MTINEIKEAVKQGKRVFFDNPNYEVIYNDAAGWLIVSHCNEHYIGLHGMEGSEYEDHCNMNLDDAYIKE